MSQQDQQVKNKIPVVHVITAVSTSVSTDKKTAMLHFRDEDGEDFALTFPVEGISAVRTMLNNLAKHDGINRGMVLPQRPQNFAVGHSDDLRGHVCITFDQDLPLETLVLFSDEIGMKLAQSIENDVLSRMTPAERAQHQRRIVGVPYGQMSKLII